MLIRNESTRDKQSAAAQKSALVELPAPDTQDQTVCMSDADFDAGLTRAVYNVHQNKDVQPAATVKLPGKL